MGSAAARRAVTGFHALVGVGLMVVLLGCGVPATSQAPPGNGQESQGSQTTMLLTSESAVRRVPVAKQDEPVVIELTVLEVVRFGGQGFALKVFVVSRADKDRKRHLAGSATPFPAGAAGKLKVVPAGDSLKTLMNEASWLEVAVVPVRGEQVLPPDMQLRLSVEIQPLPN